MTSAFLVMSCAPVCAATPKGIIGGLGSVEGAKDDQPVDLEADTLTHDEEAQTVTASGNVELVQSGRILKADMVSYNLLTDKVRATGNVVLSEADGTTYFADDVELTDDMKNGFVDGLQILLEDGSRFTAKEGTRTGGTVLNLKQASYTPCEPCKEDPSRPPLWQLRAAEVEHNSEEKRISYHDAWFEFAGVPVAYTPYFSHPDGSEKQKSGVLIPSFGYDSKLGASYQQEYYYAIAPDKDATVGAIVATSVNPVALAEYRQRFDNAELRLNGSATYSGRTDSVAGQERGVGDEVRGHLFGKALWDMNDQWRSGVDLNVASDDQYLRQYKIESDDVLENQVYAERFSGRNYMVGRALVFQDVRVRELQNPDQPAVLPEVLASFYGDPNGLLGGRWKMGLSALGLYRNGNGQDVGRGSAELGWQRRYITGFGLVNKFDALLRGDAYKIADAQAFAANNNDTTQTRGFAQGNWEMSYPFAKRLENSQIVISPIASLTAGTNIDNGDIPNEDSQGFTLDPTNLFEPNRFAGYDLIEDGSHATYGVRTGWYSDEGNKAEVFLGQSHRFDSTDNPFATGSGLSDQKSDYVGQVTAAFGNNFNLDYRFQLDHDTLASQRHELSANGGWNRLQFGSQYLFANSLQSSAVNETREQITPYVRLRFYDDWYVSGSATYDLGIDPGLRQAVYGIDYQGQCMTFAAVAERNLTKDSSGDSGTSITLRIGLKNLGSFQTSGIDIGNAKSSDSATNANDSGQ